MFFTIPIILVIIKHLSPVSCSNNVADYQHPLDPLSAKEIQMAAHIIKKFRPGIQWVFHSVVLREPEKALILEYFLQNKPVPKDIIPRKAFCMVRDRSAPMRPNQVIVNLSEGKIESWVADDDKIAPLTLQEFFEAEQITMRSPLVEERCRKAGYNLSLIEATPWPMGYIDDRPEYKGKRMAQMYMFGREFPEDNANAHPFDFLPIVDITQGKVVDIEELPTQSDLNDSGKNKMGVSTPRKQRNFDPALLKPEFFRQDLKPVRIVQEDRSFTIKGNLIHWQKFSFRVSFNAREGMVLHWVNYNDGSKVIPLFYRLSISEMFVPYADPRPPYHRRTALDEGQYGIGLLSNSLRAQEHCLGNVEFLDAVLFNEKGEPVTHPRVVCIHEEDSGIGWKHTNMRTGQPYITRRQRLVVTFIPTLGHYDYIISFNFYQDGKIEFVCKLTGILSVNLAAVNSTPTHGTLVDSQINAPFHQHWFALRIDPEIDGNKNTVVMNDVVKGWGSTGSPTNRYGNAYRINRTVFTKTGESRTHMKSSSKRHWIITSDWPIHPDKQSTGWRLTPHTSAELFLDENSPLLPVGGFTKYNVWVTPYKDDQIFAAGLYLNKSGLPEWVEKDPEANIANTDLVLWHVFTETHIPKQENWPVMSTEECIVKLDPFNFFKENPALDVPQVQRENKYQPK